ncbi:hypothetical protein POTOM_025013 [Populus tomentosa]|uniref:Uncharacterized protein n=1 Tax=Populus tomentosa TaxID=118781 RepID=A0A8X7ZKG1_POPTO|nr:hypothetical protein POTOM_025013 [Populus tomentosa]
MHQFAASVGSCKPPEVYKGKGILYIDEDTSIDESSSMLPFVKQNHRGFLLLSSVLLLSLSLSGNVVSCIAIDVKNLQQLLINIVIKNAHPIREPNAHPIFAVGTSNVNYSVLLRVHESMKAIQSTLLKIKNALHQVLLEATKRSYLSVPVFCCSHLPRNTASLMSIS